MKIKKSIKHAIRQIFKRKRTMYTKQNT